MQRITPYIFFLLVILALGMIAFHPDESWQTEKVDPMTAVLVTVGVLIGAHLLRKLGEAVYARWKSNRE